MLDRKSEAIALLNDALKELESAKGSVTVGVQKLSRASFLLEDKTIYVWSEIQLGNQRYIYPLKELFEFANKEYEKTKKTVDINNEKVEKILTTFKDEGVDYKFILTSKFVELKDSTSTGGLDHSINILEDQLPYLKKNGNDKTLYLTNVQKHIDYIKKKAHEYCVMLSNKYKYSDTSIGWRIQT